MERTVRSDGMCISWNRKEEELEERMERTVRSDGMCIRWIGK